MEAVNVVRVGAGDFNVSAGGRSISINSREMSRSKVLSQMIGDANCVKISLRLPCGYLELWLAYIRRWMRRDASINLDTSVKMLNVRYASLSYFACMC
jgi:hypothetical protein